MDAVPSPKDLRGAAAVAQSLAYVVGLAGVFAGALLYRADEVSFAMVVWVVTFAAGAVLMITAVLTRAIASLLARLAHVESDMRVLVGRQATPDADPRAAREVDPWGHQPPY